MDTRYLFKRHNTWWVKVAVPRTLRHLLGYDLRQSLKTHDLEKAQEYRDEIVASFKAKIEKARRSSSSKKELELNDTVSSYTPVTDVNNPQYYHKVVDCQYACPAHTNVPEYIRQIYQGNYI